MNESKRCGDQVVSLRIVCDPGHTHRAAPYECDLVHILGGLKISDPGEKGSIISLLGGRQLESFPQIVYASHSVGILVS